MINLFLQTDTEKVLEILRSFENFIMGAVALIGLIALAIVVFSIWYMLAESKGDKESKEKAFKSGVLIIPFAIVGALLGAVSSHLVVGDITWLTIFLSTLMFSVASVVLVCVLVHSKHIDRSKFKDEQGDKCSLRAGLLGVFFGFLGLHNFYLGNRQRGMAQLLLSLAGWLLLVGPVVSFVWGFIEGIFILSKKIERDSEGYLLK